MVEEIIRGYLQNSTLPGKAKDGNRLKLCPADISSPSHCVQHTPHRQHSDVTGPPDNSGRRQECRPMALIPDVDDNGDSLMVDMEGVEPDGLEQGVVGPPTLTTESASTTEGTSTTESVSTTKGTSIIESASATEEVSVEEMATEETSDTDRTQSTMESSTRRYPSREH